MINIAKKLTRSDNYFINFANIVALASIAIGNIALIISLSILNGFDSELRNTARKFTADICVQTFNGSELTDINNKIQIINKLDGINNITPVIQTEAIISTKHFTEGVVLRSVSFLPNQAKHPIKNNIIEGDFNLNQNEKEIIISKTLAKKLNVKIGDKILIYAMTDKQHISFSAATYNNFTIKAIYNTGMQQYDNSVIFMPFNTIADFLEFENNTATHLEVNINSLDDASYIANQIDDVLGFPVFSATYYEINRSIFA
jgi:lipoprotein-releasing system permease protein